MIKMLEDPLIEAATNPNVPGSLVAGLRKAVEDVRTGSVKGKTFAFSGVLPTLSRDEACVRIEEAGGVIVSAVSAKLDYLVAGSEAGSKLLKALELGVPVIGEKQLQAMLPGIVARLKGMITPDILPHPFDSLEEAQRAAGVVLPQVVTDPPYRVCIKTHETNVGNTVPVGHVVTLEAGELLQQPACWLRCDKDGWVPLSHDSYVGPMGLKIEWRDGAGTSDWRPLPPTPSAIDEMAEQMKRWAAPTRDDAQPVAWFDKDGKIQGIVSDEQLYAILREALADLDKRNGWAEQEEVTLESVAPALAVQEGGSHYKDMKIQPVEYIHANGLGYFEGNVVKYVSRWRAKGGLQDLKKARHYLDLLIELEGGTK